MAREDYEVRKDDVLELSGIHPLPFAEIDAIYPLQSIQLQHIHHREMSKDVPNVTHRERHGEEGVSSRGERHALLDGGGAESNFVHVTGEPGEGDQFVDSVAKSASIVCEAIEFGVDEVRIDDEVVIVYTVNEVKKPFARQGCSVHRGLVEEWNVTDNVENELNWNARAILDKRNQRRRRHGGRCMNESEVRAHIVCAR